MANFFTSMEGKFGISCSNVVECVRAFFLPPTGCRSTFIFNFIRYPLLRKANRCEGRKWWKWAWMRSQRSSRSFKCQICAENIKPESFLGTFSRFFFLMVVIQGVPINFFCNLRAFHWLSFIPCTYLPTPKEISE